LIAGVIGAALTVGGCSRPQPRLTPELPALEVPPPPPRVVEAAETEPAPTVGVVQDTAPAPAPRPKPVPAAPPRSEPKPEPPRVEGPPADAAKPAEEPPKTQPTLQTAPSQREREIEANVRRLMESATRDLQSVSPNRLNSDAKGQYESARGFLRQADEALKVRNLLLAETVADKAAKLAAELAGR
jgi:hypothetical protein